jgi:hypothetical protein
MTPRPMDAVSTTPISTNKVISMPVFSPLSSNDGRTGNVEPGLMCANSKSYDNLLNSSKQLRWQYEIVLVFENENTCNLAQKYLVSKR